MKKQYTTPTLLVEVLNFENCIAAGSTQINPGNPSGDIFVEDFLDDPDGNQDNEIDIQF